MTSAQDIQQAISEKIESAAKQLLEHFPEAQTWHDKYESTHTLSPHQVSSTSVRAQVELKLKQERTVSEYLEQISIDEYQSVILKLESMLNEPISSLNDQARLYLEQQLSDLLGFTVSTELDGQVLPTIVGVVEARPHTKRFPTDTLSLHERHKEAGLAQYRSAFGWFSPQPPLSEQAEHYERYSLGLPLYALPEWGTRAEQVKTWFRNRKVICINPKAKRFVVAAVSDISTPSIKYQFSASPELSRDIACWQPGQQGKIIVLFVDDESDTIPLGTVQLPFAHYE
ncbi:hypothetical protein KBC79_03535 [Candidatus Woesebacteria bacterium]|nr:hypothetical protein [Candidatus Woesebacteria bacterium]